jgi:hypothetical protein
LRQRSADHYRQLSGDLRRREAVRIDDAGARPSGLLGGLLRFGGSEPDALPGAGGIGRARTLAERVSAARDLLGGLRPHLRAVTEQEMRAQDETFDKDSRAGRELLFLLADDEWVRASTETVRLENASTVSTTLRFDVDLSAVSHEAFLDGDEQLELPLLVLRPPDDGSALASSVVVRHGDSRELPVPQSEVFHRFAAALSEILLGLAMQQLAAGPAAPSRDQRLLLGAALYRYLHDAVDSTAPGTSSDRPLDRPAVLTAAHRSAFERVDATLAHFLRVLEGAADEGGPSEARPPARPPSDPRLPTDLRLALRAARVLDSLRGAVCIVTVVDRQAAPGTYEVELPIRRVRRASRRLLPRVRLLPRARFSVDLLLPAPDCDRRMTLELPPGTAIARAGRRGQPPVEALVAADRPRALDQLELVMDQLLARQRLPGRPEATDTVLAQLGLAASESVEQTLRRYRPEGGEDPPGFGALRSELGRFAQSRDPDALRQAVSGWARSAGLPARLQRVLRVGTPTGESVLVTAPAVVEPDQRGQRHRGRLRVDVVLGDFPLRATAILNGSMGLALMLVVLALLFLFPPDAAATAAAAAAGTTPEPFDRQVLSGALTLFSAIQAARIEHLDRSSLRGWLGAAGYLLVAFSLMPPIVLAMALAFEEVSRNAVQACMAAIGLQSLVLAALWLLRGERFGPFDRLLGWPALRVVPIHDPARVDVLVAPWWRRTVADSLLLGREAHAYVVEQGGDSLADLLQAPRRGLTGAAMEMASTFRGILRPGTPAPSSRAVPPARSANILGLVRAGAGGRSLTFVVFREEPSEEWQRGHHAEGVQVDVERLVSRETPMTVVSVTVGAPATPEHDGDRVLGSVLEALARHELTLDEVQLPVPPPVLTRAEVPDGAVGADGAGLAWFRVRIRVRDSDIGPLAAALDDLAGLAPPGGLHALVGVAGGRAGWLAGAMPPAASPLVPVRPEDLDVLGLRSPAPGGPGPNGSGQAGVTELRSPDWLVAALCGDARTGIERDVVRWVAAHRPTLHLTGFTAALMHGMAVVFLLGHETSVHAPGELPGFDELRAEHPGDRLEVRCAGWWELPDLVGAGGLAGLSRGTDEQLLRVQLRSPETPGTLAGSLEALNRGLTELAPEDASGGGWRKVERARSPEVWFARMGVVEGRIDESVLTLRVPSPADPAVLDRVLAETEHRVREALAELRDRYRDGAKRMSRSHREDTVVRIRPVLAGGDIDLPWTDPWPPSDAPSDPAGTAAAVIDLREGSPDDQVLRLPDDAVPDRPGDTG